MASYFDEKLQIWAKKHSVEDIVNDKNLIVWVDKYNKPIDSKYHIDKSAYKELSADKKKRLDNLKSQLPYEELYFSAVYDKKNDIVLMHKKTPIQSMLNIWAIVMIIWALYRWYFKTSLPVWMDEFIAKPAVFITPLYFYITRIEKKSFLEGLSLNRFMNARHILSGIGIGLIFMLTGVFGYYLKHGSVSLTAVLSSLNMPLIMILLVSLATSFSEEVLSRGFVLKRLYEDSKNVFTAAIYSSILFFFIHIPILFTNDKIFGPLLLQVMFTDLMLSMAVSFIYIETKNLYLVLLIHAMYALSIYFFSA